MSTQYSLTGGDDGSAGASTYDEEANGSRISACVVFRCNADSKVFAMVTATRRATAKILTAILPEKRSQMRRVTTANGYV